MDSWFSIYNPFYEEVIEFLSVEKFDQFPTDPVDGTDK